MKEFIRTERRLIVAVIAIVALLNVPYGRYIMYPLLLFSTWIHEMCHGVAAIVVGGSIAKVEVFPDGSGLAYTYRPATSFAAAWVASAGYVGTSIIGATMLAFRQRRLAGRIGLTLLGVLMVLTVVLYVRNGFGMWSLLLIGFGLAAAGWTLSPDMSGWLYAFVAATCCLNAITSIRILFSPNLVIDGKPAGGSDAHTVAEALWLPYWFWASLWIALAGALMIGSLRYASKAASAAE